MNTKVITQLFGLLIVLTLGAELSAAPLQARATIKACEGEGVTGELTLREQQSEEGVKQVEVKLKVSGLPDGKHAVHLHETGVCEPCGAAKGHFDPGPHGFSDPDGNHPYHSGDLVNIEIAKGSGMMHTTTSRVSLSPGPLSLFDADGSAVIIHVGVDSYCPEGEAKGCAGGARVACGVIEWEK